MPLDKFGNWYEVDPDIGMAGAAPRPQIANTTALQDWYDFGVRDAANGQTIMIPRILASDLRYWAGSGDMSDPTQYGIAGGPYGAFGTGNYGLWNQLGNANNNFQMGAYTPGANSFDVRIKSADKEGTGIRFERQGDYYVPTANTGAQYWDTNSGVMDYLPLLMAGGFGLGSALLGGGAAAGAGGMAAGEGAMLGGGVAPLTYGGAGGMTGGLGTTAAGLGGAAGAGGSWGLVDQGALAGAGGGGGLTATGAPGTLGAGSYGGMTGSAASQMPSWLTQAGKVAGGVGSLLGGSSGLGGLIGAGLGYLDARNQPDSMTVRQEIDPRLAEFAYGAQGVAPAATNLLQQQLGQPNPLTQAGQQISGMANTLPNWNQLVTDAKGQWDANPFIQQQQQAITDMATRNLRENVLPGIGTQAGYAGGYGGSRQGVAEALAMSRLNQDLAPALTGLASNAWESGQNRALSSAGQAGNYGLNSMGQNINALTQGANLQAMGPWNPINQAAGVMRGLPGNSSTVTPLFNNIYGNMLGGASLGSQIGGGINWDDLFGGIGGLLGGLFK